MTELVRPDLRYRDSWLAAVDEFVAAGVVMHGSGLWQWDPADRADEALGREVRALLAADDPATELPEGIVPSTYFWITDGDDFVGYLALRHALTPFLLETGGHIGYAVRPSRQGQGHATRALGLALEEARRIGLDRVLLTCDVDNEPSAGVIEANGGVLEDVRQDKRRYWIDLRPAARG